MNLIPRQKLGKFKYKLGLGRKQSHNKCGIGLGGGGRQTEVRLSGFRTGKKEAQAPFISCIPNVEGIAVLPPVGHLRVPQ